MRICHASNFLTGCHKKTGGAEMACHLVVEMLRKKEIENTILSLKCDKKKLYGVYEPTSMEDYLGRLGRFYKILLPFDPFIYTSAKKIFRKIKPDILHLHNFNFLSLSLINAAKHMKIPIIYSIYDYWAFCPIQRLATPSGEFCNKFHGLRCKKCFGKRKFPFIQTLSAGMRKWFFAKALAKVNYFITLSDNSKEILMKYGISAEKIKTIHLPMLDKKVQTPKKIEKNSILFAGWLEDHKGLKILLKAMPKVLAKIPSVKLYALSMSDNQNKIQKTKKAISNLGIEKNVFFSTERIAPEKFKRIYQQSSIVVIPEQWNNMSPLMVSEAMSMSKPVIASRIGGIPEFVKDRITGKLVKEIKNPEKWASAVISILKNKKKMQEMGKNAGIYFKKLYDKDKILKELLALYDKAYQNGGNSG